MLTVFHNSYIYMHSFAAANVIIAEGIGIAKESAWKHHTGSDHGDKAGLLWLF